MYVRRFSLGATLSVAGLPLVPDKTIVTSTTTPPVATQYQTKGASQRIGYGATAQLAVSGHFALNASVLLRKVGYEMTTTTVTGTTTTTTETRHEDTRARLIDIPAMVRYYSRDRHDPGPRWFIELGGVLRKASHIRTSIDTRNNAGDLTCCEITSVQPAHRTAHGLVGGLGVQVTDPVGIRVVPEVRYTHWISDTFNSQSTYTQRHQIEAMISLTF